MNYEILPQSPPENIGRSIWKVMRLQLLIFASYQFLFALLLGKQEMGFMFLDMFPLALHWLLLLIFMIVSFTSQKKGAGFGYLISFILILIIGFGSCILIPGIFPAHSYR
jgi:hypothetical protein